MKAGIKEAGEEIISSVRQVDISGATSQMPCSDFFRSDTDAADAK